MGSKSIKHRYQKINKNYQFLMILVRFGVPSCGHVGDIFGKKGRPGKMLLSSFLRCCCFSNFGVSGPSLDPIGLHFGSIWAPFWLHLASILAPFGFHF